MRKDRARAMHAKENGFGKVIAYDVVKKMKTEMLNPKKVRTKNGRWMLKGTSKWGTQMAKFIKG